MPTTFDTTETEDARIIGIQLAGQPVCDAAITDSGTVYLRGDIHPLGSAKALMLAGVMHIPYIAVSAVSVLYPADWLRAECTGCRDSLDRRRIIDNLEAMVRRSA